MEKSKMLILELLTLLGHNSYKNYSLESKNALLIELVHALHASGSVSYGRIGIRKISFALEKLF